MWTSDGRSAALERKLQRQRDHDAEVLPRLAALRGLGLSDRRIAALLELDGYRPPRAKWSHMAVQRIRKRHGVR